MLPAVSKFGGVEMIRDGGSLSLTFGSNDGSRYMLFVQILLEERTFSYEILGYGPPILIDCGPAKRPADTETLSYGELSGPKFSITWHEAGLLLDDFLPLVPELDEWCAEWLRMIVFFVKNDGRCPPDRKVLLKSIPQVSNRPI